MAALCRRLDGLPLALELAAASGGPTPSQAVAAARARLGETASVQAWQAGRSLSLAAAIDLALAACRSLSAPMA